MEQPKNPLTHLFLAWLNPDRKYFTEVLKAGAKETVGVILQNIGESLRAPAAQNDPNQQGEKKHDQ